MKKKVLKTIISILIIIVIIILISLFIILKTKLEKNENRNNLLSNTENSKIKYLKYSSENGYTMSGGYYTISVNEQIIAEEYTLSQETLKYERTERQIWTKEKWDSFEKELYDMGLENWSKEQEEVEKKIDDFLMPTDGNTYNLTVIFRDNSEMKLGGYWSVEFDISDILYRYFKE